MQLLVRPVDNKGLDIEFIDNIDWPQRACILR